MVNFIDSFVEYSFLFPLVQKYKNRPRKARVIIKNKVARFYGSRCIMMSCIRCDVRQELVLVIWFGTEFIVRIWSAGYRSLYHQLAGRLKFLRRPLCIVGRSTKFLQDNTIELILRQKNNGPDLPQEGRQMVTGELNIEQQCVKYNNRHAWLRAVCSRELCL